MRYFQLAILCFLWVAKSYGQTAVRSYGVVVEITKEKKLKKIYTKVEIKPHGFPDVDSAWIHSLQESLNQSIPYKNGAKPGKYIISVALLIEKDGSLVDTRCLKDPGFGMCEQVTSAIKRTFPRKGSPVKVRPYAH